MIKLDIDFITSYNVTHNATIGLERHVTIKKNQLGNALEALSKHNNQTNQTTDRLFKFDTVVIATRHQPCSHHWFSVAANVLNV